MKKIDVHVHTSMWGENLPSFNTPLATPQQVIERYEELNIEKGFIMPLLSPESRNFVQSNEEVIHIADKYKESFYCFCNIDPRMVNNTSGSDLSKLIEHYKEKGAKGVGEVTANMYIDEHFMENLFYHCAQCDMPVTIHIAPQKCASYGVVDDLNLPRLEKILKKYPSLKILGHSQCFWSEISADVTAENRNGYPKGKVVEGTIARLMRECPNLYCDLSAGSGYNAISRDEDYAYKFIEEFADRLLFGTDLYMPHQQSLLSSWLDKAYENGHITEENYKKICRENAMKLFNL